MVQGLASAYTVGWCQFITTEALKNSVTCSCVFQKADKEGILGVQLNKDIVKVASKALESNLTLLGPKVLPYAEQLLFAYDFVLRRFGWRAGKPYQPKFRKAFDHFCLHAGVAFLFRFFLLQ